VDAAGYHLNASADKGTPPTTFVAAAPSGSPGATAPMPAEPLLYIHVLAGNCCGESAR